MLKKVGRWFNENFIGVDGDDYAEEEMGSDPMEHSPSDSFRSNALPFGKKAQSSKMILHESPRVRMVVAAPSSFHDAKQICEQLKSRRPVVLNLENVDDQLARRIADFMQGAVAALDASIYKVTSDIVVIAPKDVEISGEYCDIDA